VLSSLRGGVAEVAREASANSHPQTSDT
jgi:hypothetical protein